MRTKAFSIVCVSTLLTPPPLLTHAHCTVICAGLQTQTAECLVVGEVATTNLVVVLNKVDMLPEEGRAKAIKKAYKRLAQTFNLTKFAGVTMIPVSVKPGARPEGRGRAPGP